MHETRPFITGALCGAHGVARPVVVPSVLRRYAGGGGSDADPVFIQSTDVDNGNCRAELLLVPALMPLLRNFR
jgi:hypothetical protein